MRLVPKQLFPELGITAPGTDSTDNCTNQTNKGDDQKLDSSFLQSDDTEKASHIGSFAEGSVHSILYSILEDTDDAIFVIDSEGTFRYSNEACRTLFDRDKGEL